MSSRQDFDILNLRKERLLINKEQERKILELIVDTSKVQITDNGCNQPDFILHYPLEATNIGIEITGLYFNHSSARLKNIDDYFSEIVNLGKFRDKKDERLLHPKDCTKINKDGSEGTPFRAILSQYSNPLENYRNALIDSIQKKNTKYSKLNMGYDYTNLLIYDFENCLAADSFIKDHFHKYIMDDKLFSLIIGSCFDEIYFITRFVDGGFYIGLKLLLILSDVYQLGQYLLGHEQKMSRLMLHYTDVLYEVLSRKGFSDITKGMVEHNKVVNIGFYSIGMDAIKGFLIYHHYPSKNDSKVYEDHSAKFFSDDEYKDFVENYKHSFFQINAWSKVNVHY